MFKLSRNKRKSFEEEISKVGQYILEKKKTIKIKNKIYEANNFHIFSNDNKKMKDKKINIKLWYSEIDYLWLKASYEKIGTWEYRLEDVKY